MGILPAALPLVLSLTVMSLPTAQDRPEKSRMPKKGDTIVVKGCLEGQLLRATETSILDETGRMATPLTYRLKGDKKLLTALRSEHDGRLVEVIGELKSTLPQPAPRGVTVGKTRIVVGVGAAPTSSAQAVASESLPVLDLESYEGTPVICRGA